MADLNKNRYCVIMCGGIGSRFWPYSRTDRPKQFLDFFGTGRSLLQMTFDRMAQVVPAENILILTNERYASLVSEQLPSLPEGRILLEPARRNTAPCIAWAAMHIAAENPDASMIVTPSDHLITGERSFEEAINRGFEFVENNDALLTLGIKPSRPETGYGYIQIGENVTGNINSVKTFTEKPNLELAKVFLETGEFFWNSGIFLWSAKSILAALRRHASDVMVTFERGAELFGTSEEKNFIEENFPGCISISIDFAVMEKATNVFVETVSFGWSDLGTWSALKDHSENNEDNNATQGCNLLSYNSSGNIFAVPSGKLVAVDSLNGFIVADTGDVLLICPLSEEQRIKQFVTDAQMKFEDTYL